MRWEHKVVDVDTGPITTEEVLDEWGRASWELVSYYRGRCLFKRPLE